MFLFNIFLFLLVLFCVVDSAFGINGKVSRKRKVVRRRKSPIRPPNERANRSRSCTRPYDMDARVMVADMERLNLPMVNADGLPYVVYPHPRTRRRWRRRLQTEGHIYFYRGNGGRS